MMGSRAREHHGDSLFEDSFYNVDDGSSRPSPNRTTVATTAPVPAPVPVQQHQPHVISQPRPTVMTTAHAPAPTASGNRHLATAQSFESDDGSFYNIDVPIAELGSLQQRSQLPAQFSAAPSQATGAVDGWMRNDFNTSSHNLNAAGADSRFAHSSLADLTPSEIAEIDALCGIPALIQLVEMGFPAQHCRIALKECDGDVSRAITFCLEHGPDEMQWLIRAEANRIARNASEPVPVTPAATAATEKPKKGIFQRLFKTKGADAKRSSNTSTVAATQPATGDRGSHGHQRPVSMPAGAHAPPQTHGPTAQPPHPVQHGPAPQPSHPAQHGSTAPHSHPTSVQSNHAAAAQAHAANRPVSMPVNHPHAAPPAAAAAAAATAAHAPPPMNPNFVDIPSSPPQSVHQHGHRLVAEESWEDFDQPIPDIMRPPPKAKTTNKNTPAATAARPQTSHQSSPATNQKAPAVAAPAAVAASPAGPTVQVHLPPQLAPQSYSHPPPRRDNVTPDGYGMRGYTQPAVQHSPSAAATVQAATEVPVAPVAADPAPVAQHPRLTHALLDLPSSSHYGSLMDIGEVIQQLQTRPVSTSNPTEERPVTPASPGAAKPVPPPKPPRSNHNSMRFQSTPVLTESMVMGGTEPVAETAAPFASGFHFSSQQNLNNVSMDIPMIQTFGLEDHGFSFSSPSHKDDAADSPEGRHQHQHGLHNPDRVVPATTTTTTATQENAAQSATSYYGSVLFTDPLVAEAQSFQPTVEAPSVAPAEDATVAPVAVEEVSVPEETEPAAAVPTGAFVALLGTPAASEETSPTEHAAAVEATDSQAIALPAEEPVEVSAAVEPAAEAAIVAAVEVDSIAADVQPVVDILPPASSEAVSAVEEQPAPEVEPVAAPSSVVEEPVAVDVPVEDEPIEIVGEAHFITSAAPAAETHAPELSSADEETFIADPIPPEDVAVAPSAHDEFFPSEAAYAHASTEAVPLDAEFEPSLSYYNFDTGVADHEAFEVVGTAELAHDTAADHDFSAFGDTPVPPAEATVTSSSEAAEVAVEEAAEAAAPVIVQIIAPPQMAPVILPTTAVVAAAGEPVAAAASDPVVSEPQSPEEADVVSPATTVEAVAEEAGFHEFEEAPAEAIPADEDHAAVVAEATAVPADWDEGDHVEATAAFTMPSEVANAAAVTAAAVAAASAPTVAAAVAMDTRSSRSSSGSAATTTTAISMPATATTAAATSAAAASASTPLYLVPPTSAATSVSSNATSFDRNHPPHYESLEHMPTITIEASSVFVDPPIAATAQGHGAADSPLSSASSNSSAPLSGTHGSLHRRQPLSYRIEAQRNGKLRAIVSLKQPHLKRSENSPQGNRPDEIILGDCATDAIARDLCECYAPPIWMSKQTIGQGNVCTLCQVSFSMFSQPHHCRNCGYLICGQCSDKIWPGSMLPETFHDDEPHKMVRVCHACHCLADLFVVALCQGDYQTVRALYASGNINLHQPYAVYAHHAYPVHYAVLGGNLDILRWLMDVKRCSSVNVAQKQPLATQTGWTLLGLAAYCGHVDMIQYLVQQKRCSVTEIKDVVTLQRAMHALLKLPGPMPEFNVANKAIPQSAVTVQALQDELLRMVILHRPRGNAANAAPNGAVAHAAVASAARHELEGAAIAEAFDAPAMSSSGHAVYGTAIHNNNSYIPSATAQEAPIIVSNRIEAAPVQINALGILTQTTTTPNMFSKATLTRPLPKNRFLCPQAVFRVQEFLELQRRSMFYTLPPSLNHNGTVAAPAAVPTASATSTVRASGSNSDVVALASLVNSAAMNTALASPVPPASATVATASATPSGGGSEHSSHRSGRNSAQSSARQTPHGHGHGHHSRR